LIGLGAALDCHSDQQRIDADRQRPDPAIPCGWEHGGQMAQGLQRF
jgi:hypothetical protein